MQSTNGEATLQPRTSGKKLQALLNPNTLFRVFFPVVANKIPGYQSKDFIAVMAADVVCTNIAKNKKKFSIKGLQKNNVM